MANTDAQLIIFIRERATKHKDGIVQHPNFLAFVLSLGSGDDLLEELIQIFMTKKNAKETTEGLLSSLLLPPASMEAPIAAPAAPRLERIENRIGSAMLTALRQGRLALGMKDGYGTLVQDRELTGTIRNEDFRFRRGQLSSSSQVCV